MGIRRIEGGGRSWEPEGTGRVNEPDPEERKPVEEIEELPKTPPAQDEYDENDSQTRNNLRRPDTYDSTGRMPGLESNHENQDADEEDE